MKSIYFTFDYVPFLRREAVKRVRGIISRQRADISIFPGTHTGQELAARLAVRLGIPVVSGVYEIELAGDDCVRLKSSVCAGELLSTEIISPPCLICLDHNVEAEELGIDFETADISKTTASDDFSSSSLGDARGLEDAELIIAAGRGVGSRPGFERLLRLSDSIGAAVGATRPVVMNGWASMGIQIGVSGAAVAPRSMLVLGASGSEAFTAGISEKTTVIAVDKRKDAPIFRRADYGIVSDCLDILTSLEKKTEET